MVAGLLFAGPFTFFAYVYMADLHIRKIAFFAASTMMITGLIWLWDELREQDGMMPRRGRTR
jgi:hypothetical protein